MDFDQAIASHSSWKSKLRAYLAKPDRSLAASDVAQDHKCDLGKWINGEGKAYASLPEFQTLHSEHSRFHKAASDVIQHADSGKNVTEEVALGGKSEFSSASSSVVNALMAMKHKVSKQPVSTR